MLRYLVAWKRIQRIRAEIKFKGPSGQEKEEIFQKWLCKQPKWVQMWWPQGKSIFGKQEEKFLFENCLNSLWLSSIKLENIFSVEALYNISFPYIINIYYINKYITYKIGTYAINWSYQGIYFPFFRWFPLKETKCNNLIPHKCYWEYVRCARATRIERIISKWNLYPAN